MGTAEGRSLAGVIAGVLLGVGIPQCVSAPILGWSCITVAAFLLLSLYLGWPIRSLRIGTREGSEDGIPRVAPIDYQISQLRQVIVWFHGEPFGLFDLVHALPKVSRTGRITLYEPLHGSFSTEALEFMVTDGELEAMENGFQWRATGEKPPKYWLRWRHGKDPKA